MFARASSMWMGMGQAGGAGDALPAAGGLAGGLMQFAPLLMMVVVMYVLMLRPANKQKREHAAFLAALSKDDEVLTDSGLWARIVALDERVATIEVAERVRLRIQRSRIQGAWAAAAAPPAPRAAAAAPKAAASR